MAFSLVEFFQNDYKPFNVERNIVTEDSFQAVCIKDRTANVPIKVSKARPPFIFGHKILDLFNHAIGVRYTCFYARTSAKQQNYLIASENSCSH